MYAYSLSTPWDGCHYMILSELSGSKVILEGHLSQTPQLIRVLCSRVALFVAPPLPHFVTAFTVQKNRKTTGKILECRPLSLLTPTSHPLVMDDPRSSICLFVCLFVCFCCLFASVYYCEHNLTINKTTRLDPKIICFLCGLITSQATPSFYLVAESGLGTRLAYYRQRIMTHCLHCDQNCVDCMQLDTYISYYQ